MRLRNEIAAFGMERHIVIVRIVRNTYIFAVLVKSHIQIGRSTLLLRRQRDTRTGGTPGIRRIAVGHYDAGFFQRCRFARLLVEIGKADAQVAAVGIIAVVGGNRVFRGKRTADCQIFLKNTPYRHSA